MTEPMALGIREAAEALGVSQQTVRRLLAEGRLRRLRVGKARSRGRILIPTTELRRFVETATVKQARSRAKNHSRRTTEILGQ